MTVAYLVKTFPTSSPYFQSFEPGLHSRGLDIILILSYHLRLDFRSSLLPSSLAINNVNPFLGPKTLNGESECGVGRCGYVSSQKWRPTLECSKMPRLVMFP